MFFRTLVLVLFSAFLVSGCTAENQTSSREPASARSKSKSKKKRMAKKSRRSRSKKRSFYIPYSKLSKLSYSRQRAYYRIFALAALDYQKLIKATRGRSASFQDPLKQAMEQLIPYAEADPCTTAMNVIDIGKECTVANSWKNPMDEDIRENYEPYMAIGEMAQGPRNCASKGLAPCPGFAMQIVDGLAQVACSDNKMRSSSCNKNQYFDTTVKLQDECKRQAKDPSFNRSVSTPCSDINGTVANAVKMYDDNCVPDKYPDGQRARRMYRNICNSIGSAVRKIRKETEEDDDKDKSVDTSCPETETCNMLCKQVESKVIDRTGGEQPSATWDKLLDMSVAACPGIRDKNQARRKFGICTRDIAGVAKADLGEKLADLQRNYRAAAGTPQYETRFMQTLGLSTDQYKRVFCGRGDSTSPYDFKKRIENDLENAVFRSEYEFIKNLRFKEFSESSTLDLSQKEFDVLKAWYEENRRQLKRYDQDIAQAKVRQFRRYRGTSSHPLISDMNVTLAEAVIRASSGEEADRFFRDSESKGLKGKDKDRQMDMRAALHSSMIKALVSNEQNIQMLNATDMLKRCARDVIKNGKAEEMEVDGEMSSVTRKVSNYGCFDYNFEGNLESYLLEDDHQNAPYVLYDTQQKQCFQQDGPIDRSDVSNNGGTTVITPRADFVSPLSNTVGLRGIALTDNMIATDGKNARFRLYKFEKCPDKDADPLADDDSAI